MKLVQSGIFLEILHQFDQQSQDHVVWCINYLLSPTTLITNFSDFAAMYLNDFPSLSFLSQDDINWLADYPYIKSRIFYFLQNPAILNAEQKVQFHINKMRTESTYLTFNFAYSSYPEYKDLWFNDFNFLYPYGGNMFGEWAVNYLMEYPSIQFETFKSQFMPSVLEPQFDYSNLNMPVFVNDDIVQMPLGFDFQYENFNATPDPPIRQIGSIDKRNNEEDMEWGTDGDVAGILSHMPISPTRHYLTNLKTFLTKPA